MSAKPLRLFIEFDQSQLRAATFTLDEIPGGIKRAQVRAINETAKTGRTRIGRDVRDKVTLKLKTVYGKVGVRRATKGQIIPSAQIRIRNTKFPASDFNISPRRPVSQKGVPVAKRKPKIGVGLKAFKAGARTPIERSWVHIGKGGRLFVLNRQTTAARADPRIVYGPNISDAMGETPDFPRLRAGLQDVLEKNLNRQVQHELSKARKN